MTDRVLTRVENHVATVTLNRADKRNAVDFAMFEALADVAAALGDDPSVRAVVLHGDGSDFCAGIDISVFQGAGIGAAGQDLMQPLPGSTANFFQNAALAWRELPVPVIAALQGSVFGAGLQIAMGADLRYAAPDTKMSIMEIKWGLIPDMGITTTLRHVVPVDRVKELAWTGRILAAAEMMAYGLVTDIDDDALACAQAIAAEIAAKSPDAVRAIKKLINESWHDDPASALKREAELQTAVMGGKNQKEAALANLERRKPDFSDPDS